MGQVSKKLPVACQVTFKVWQLGDFRMHSKSGLPRSVETVPANRAIVPNMKIMFFQEADSYVTEDSQMAKHLQGFQLKRTRPVDFVERVRLELFDCGKCDDGLLSSHATSHIVVLPLEVRNLNPKTPKTPWDFLKNHRFNELNKSKEELQKCKESTRKPARNQCNVRSLSIVSRTLPLKPQRCESLRVSVGCQDPVTGRNPIFVLFFVPTFRLDRHTVPKPKLTKSLEATISSLILLALHGICMACSSCKVQPSKAKLKPR